MAHVKILMNCREEVTSDGDFWESRSNYDYYGAEISDEYPSEAVDFEPFVGQVVFLVYVDYDTGNSFGRSYGERMAVGIYSTEEEARDVVSLIRKYQNGNNKREPVIHKGITISTYEWNGYFDRFNHCDFERLTIR